MIANHYSAAASGPKATPSAIEEVDLNTKFVKWGTDNTYPKQFQTDVESDTVILPGVRLNAKLLYGGGLVYGKIVPVDHDLDWQYSRDLVIERWLRANNIARQLFMLFYDLSLINIAYPLFTLSADGKSIARMSMQYTRAINTRLSPVNAYGEHTMAFTHPDMGTSDFKNADAKQFKTAPSFNTVEWIRKNVKGGESFVVPIKGVDTGRQVYPMPDVESARKSKWVRISKTIAALNEAALLNGMRPMWHIEIHDSFWPNWVGAEVWASLEIDNKKAKIKEFNEAISKQLIGVENTGNYISSPMVSLPGVPDKILHLIKITPLENKMALGSDGWYLTTSREASQHKLSAMSLTPALTGMMPGDGGLGAGSGSNNRVELNQRVLMSVADQSMFLNWMYMVAEYNGWDEELEFVIKQGLVTTMDQGKETQTKLPAAVNPTSNE